MHTNQFWWAWPPQLWQFHPLFKMAKISLRTMDYIYSPWESKNGISSKVSYKLRLLYACKPILVGVASLLVSVMLLLFFFLQISLLEHGLHHITNIISVIYDPIYTMSLKCL